MKTLVTLSLSVLLRMRNVGDEVVEKLKKYCFLEFFFSKILPFMRKCEKYCRAGQATHDNMAHAHCMLDIKGYKHTHTKHEILIAFPRQ